MPFSGKLQTETKLIPMKLQPQKSNTKPIFILPRKYQYLTKFYIDRIQHTDKIPIKYQEIEGRNTKYRFGIGIFLVYQSFGLQLTSLVQMTIRAGLERRHESRLRTVLTWLTIHENSERAVRLSVGRDKSKLWVAPSLSRPRAQMCPPECIHVSSFFAGA